MRIRPRLGLVVIVVLSLVVLQGAPGALAQTPTPSPSPSESPSPQPSPTQSPSPSPSPSPTPTKSPTPSPSPSPTPSPSPQPSPRPPQHHDNDEDESFFHPEGAFNTDRLVALAIELRGLGWSERRIIKQVYPPFIVAGPAAWVNTWGAPRFGPAPGEVRTHEGQDVFCREGDPVLASERGTIEFDSGGLGGRVARLHRPEGGYWYYAHLSDWNTRRFSDGDTVEVGDVIGFCGNTGNAAGTSPHVHFGWYDENGTAHDPMRFLVKWLREANRRALGSVDKTTDRRERTIEAHITRRLFGDAFAPDLSEQEIPSEALWAAGANPASGAFGLAQSALQAALAQNALRDVTAQSLLTRVGSFPAVD